ncbi:MAG: Uma2 family endonuclease [Isosphaeraceae bacterium]
MYLIIEVTSPKTPVNDLETKVEEYARAEVPHYVVVVAVEKNNQPSSAAIAGKPDPISFRNRQIRHIRLASPNRSSRSSDAIDF